MAVKRSVLMILVVFGMLFCPSAAFADRAAAFEAKPPCFAVARAASTGEPLGSTVLSGVASPSASKLVVRVGRVANATGYQFRIGTDKALKANVKLKTSSSRSVTFTGLVSGERYYVRARAFRVVDGKTTWGAWSVLSSATVKYKPGWEKEEGYFKYLKEDGSYARGLTTIGVHTYYFDKSCRQKLGWQKVKGQYRFFEVANKARGFMAAASTVNGIGIRKDGTAKVTAGNKAEVSIMRKAQKLAEKLTYPAQSKRAKLKRCFNYLKNECVEKRTRNFSYYKGWHRAFARDVFNHATGSCWSYGAALAYLANAVGCKSCVIVSSGGHGWAEIDSKVYDPEWSRHCGRNLFAIPYGESGRGIPSYASSRAYTVTIAPNAARWKR